MLRAGGEYLTAIIIRHVSFPAWPPVRRLCEMSHVSGPDTDTTHPSSIAPGDRQQSLVPQSPIIDQH